MYDIFYLTIQLFYSIILLENAFILKKSRKHAYVEVNQGVGVVWRSE